MKLGYTVWTWMVKEKNLNYYPVDDTKFYFEQACKEMKDLGYPCIENFDFIASTYENDTNEFNELMEKYGLEFINLYNYFSNDQKADLAKTERYCKWMNKVGAKQMSIQALMWFDQPANRPTDYEAIGDYCKRSDEMGKLCAAYGIELLMHPHLNTAVLRDNEIEYFCNNTNPDYVNLCLDTGHMIPIGDDPVKLFDKYFDRLHYVHYKDAFPDVNHTCDWPLKLFRELGHGVVDFKGVHDLLVSRGYDGPVVVELDRPRVCNYDSAQVSREYLRKVLGI